MTKGNDLHHESIYDALRTAVLAAGGFQKVGVLFRPEWDEKPDQAGRWLADCLNEHRNEKLSIEQVLRILRMARRVGCHVGIEQITKECGYTVPSPVEPEDELAQCYREFTAGIQQMAGLAERIERTVAGMRKEPRE